MKVPCIAGVTRTRFFLDRHLQDRVYIEIRFTFLHNNLFLYFILTCKCFIYTHLWCFVWYKMKNLDSWTFRYCLLHASEICPHKGPDYGCKDITKPTGLIQKKNFVFSLLPFINNRNALHQVICICTCICTCNLQHSSSLAGCKYIL